MRTIIFRPPPRPLSPSSRTAAAGLCAQVFKGETYQKRRKVILFLIIKVRRGASARRRNAIVTLKVR